jgi:hypothetical protein
MAVRCECTVVAGCELTKETETVAGSCFVRLWLRGPDARRVLMTLMEAEALALAPQYRPIESSGAVWPSGDGWCTILAGRLGPRPARPARTPRTRQDEVPWTPAERARLAAAYQQGGHAAARHAFPSRSYASIDGQLRSRGLHTPRRRAVMRG